MIGSTNP